MSHTLAAHAAGVSGAAQFNATNVAGGSTAAAQSSTGRICCDSRSSTRNGDAPPAKILLSPSPATRSGPPPTARTPHSRLATPQHQPPRRHRHRPASQRETPHHQPPRRHWFRPASHLTTPETSRPPRVLLSVSPAPFAAAGRQPSPAAPVGNYGILPALRSLQGNPTTSLFGIVLHASAASQPSSLTLSTEERFQTLASSKDWQL